MQFEHVDSQEPDVRPGLSMAFADNDPLTLIALRAMMRAVLPEIPVIWSTRDGNEAVANSLAHATRPTLLLVDMDMDGLPGDRVCRSIRERTSDVILLCMTAHSLDRYRTIAKESGAQALLDKADTATMTNVIRAWIHGEMPIRDTFDAPQKAYDRLSKALTRTTLLSATERQVMDLCAEGKTSKAIAEILGKSEPTVKTHIRHAIAKLGASSKLDASIMWMQQRRQS
ncbi:response regulator transcription factor [Bifidobacterium amazonense]|uniref:Response regulator transcription factor n=1 Tax=Bifidobacterium amazonense TaxID=2809027 RepID=A0ABS9VVZ6_9BIFI|nr:response regulator transcription factor [Bifidobacterium amazonense]MCH9276288.1 response regulator transcription factor [Bifidobacterium amazonense]